MKKYELAFGKIIILKNNLAEVIVDEGVVMNEVMVDVYHDFLLSSLDAPFSVLINKKHSYSYTFEAQKIIGNLKEIFAMAVVNATSGALMSTETLIDINKQNNWNVNLFDNREDALEWLEKITSNVKVE